MDIQLAEARRVAMKLGTGNKLHGYIPVFPWVARGEDPPDYEVRPDGEVLFRGTSIGGRETEHEARTWAWYRWTYDHRDGTARRWVQQ